MLSQALQAGVRAIQLREKDLDTIEVYRLGERLLSLTRQAGAALIVNVTPIVCGLFVALVSETVIVAAWVPTPSASVANCTLWALAAPVDEPLSGETVSHGALLAIV